jgi:general secretion pathway protein D
VRSDVAGLASAGHRDRPLVRGTAGLVAFVMLLTGMPLPRAASAADPPAAAAPAAQGNPNSITLNFRDAEVDTVIGAFGHLLNRTFIIDPRVRGKITLETPRPVTRAQAFQLLQSQLRLQGFAIVESGQISRVVPEADAKLQNSPVGVGRSELSSGDQIVTQIFRLSYESASNLVPVLRPLISANNTISAYPSNNSLVITDYSSNLQRLGKIIATLDSPSTSEVEVIPVRHALATDLAVSVSRLLDDSQRAGAGAQVDPGQRVSVMADTRINALMVRSSSLAKLNLAKSLVARLDQPSNEPGNIHVVYLRNAEAARLAIVLRSVLSGDSGAQGTLGQGISSLSQNTPPAGSTGVATGTQNTPGATPLAQSSATPANVTVNAGGVIIAADSSTNSLIITAPAPLYRNLRAVIDKLDARRVQVFIESLIVEVSAEKAAEFGIQWQFLSQGSGTGSTVVGGTNLPARSTGSNILDATANILALGQGLNIGLIRSGSVIGGATGAVNLGLLARALESGANANILATPNLLTLDNEEARIIIGQNVPFITGQFSATGTSGAAVNPFQTIERRDVGTTLRVRPQVSEAGTVKLQIFQEVSNVQDRTLAAGLITNRRAIESNVLVDDGQIVVLGGLIEERVEGGSEKVPGLGDLPFVGQMFRYDSRKRTKTNLLVFLRPVVVRDANAAHSVTADRYDYIRGLQGDSRLPQRFLLPDFPPSDLPTMPKPPGDASAPRSPAIRNGPASLSPDIDNAARRSIRVEVGPAQGITEVRPEDSVAPRVPQGAPPVEPKAGN